MIFYEKLEDNIENDAVYESRAGFERLSNRLERLQNMADEIEAFNKNFLERQQ